MATTEAPDTAVVCIVCGCTREGLHTHADGPEHFCPTVDDSADTAAERANDTADHFGIGATVWPGISKLMEECAEVIQVCAKLVATGGRTDHWSGDDLSDRLVEEIGDLQAAILYVRAHNGRALLDWAAVERRVLAKYGLFQEWDGKARRAEHDPSDHLPELCPTCIEAGAEGEPT